MVDPRLSKGRRRDRYDRQHALLNPHSVLIRSKLAPDLLDEMIRFRRVRRSDGSVDDVQKATFDVIIEMNELFPGGAKLGREVLFAILLENKAEDLGKLLQEVADNSQGAGTLARLADHDTPLMRAEVLVHKSRMTPTYAFARMDRKSIERLASLKIEIVDFEPRTKAENAQFLGPEPVTITAIDLVHRIWRDHPLETFVYKSAQTIKADAARAAFDCQGREIIWAVADTGVDAAHPHFRKHRTLELPTGIRHRDFTLLGDDAGDLDRAEASALTDRAGHGTHVAGIIAGETTVREEQSRDTGTSADAPSEILVKREVRLSQAEVGDANITVAKVSGVAPLCKIVSLKVLNDKHQGNVSDILAAIGYVHEVNDYGRRIRIHGLNLSVGYAFDPQWFAPGQSALCVEVNRLVKSGVVVVAAAGNAGYGRVTTFASRSEQAAFLCTISDPGNAEYAITVGSTHRDMPHTYGVSYFSGKGPTADGRLKPDLVAPGERIVSCAAGESSNGTAVFKEDSGTSMAAPHVSGAIAAFLSVRGEFIGQPERVKEIFVEAATDLRRQVEFQGGGVLDLMRALQSI